MADQLVRGPNNTLIRYVDQLDGTHAEQVSVIGGGGGAGVTDGDKGDITVSGSGATWTVDNGAVTLAKMANLATDTVIGRDTAGTGVPEAITFAALESALATLRIQSEAVTVYTLQGASEALRKPTIAVSQTLAKAAYFSLPNGFPARGVGLLLYSAQKVTGGAGTASLRSHIDVPGATLTVSNDLHGLMTLSTSANGGVSGATIFYGNGTDQTSVRTQTALNQANPFQSSVLSASFVTYTFNMNQALELSLSLTTDATDTAKIIDAVLIVFDPDAMGAAGSDLPRSVSGSGDFTLEDKDRVWVETSGGSAIVMDIDGALAYRVGDVLEIRQGSASATATVQMAAGTGTLNAVTGATTSTASQGQSVRVRCIDSTLGAQVWEYI